MKNTTINVFLFFTFIVLLSSIAVYSFYNIPASDTYSKIMQPIGFALLMLIFCCFFFPYMKIIMQQEQKAQEVTEINEPPKETKETKPPKPTTYNAIMEITIINNLTDKEHIVKSDNNFGLTWDFTTNDIKNELLAINQRLEYVFNGNSRYLAKGRYYNFSVINCVWKTFEIEPPFAEPLQNRNYEKE